MENEFDTDIQCEEIYEDSLLFDKHFNEMFEIENDFEKDTRIDQK